MNIAVTESPAIVERSRMNYRSKILLAVWWVILALASCSKRPATAPQSDARELSSATPVAKSAKAKIDACALLTSDEIKSVQGEPIKDTHSSSNSGRGFLVSQCYFLLPTSTNSISFALTQTGEGPDARDPKEFWRETFHPESEGASEREKGRRGEEEEEKKAPPQKIEELGEEAYWIGAHISTALYVLKRDCFIRISVGGAVGDTSTKLEKSKKLAQFALKRL